MPDATLPTSCLRLFAHGPHDTQVGRCKGVSARTVRLTERAEEARAELHPPASTECPHAGCVHDAATPDAAHHMDLDLVTALQALGAAHGPRGLALALEALWPGLVPVSDLEDPLEGMTTWKDRHGDTWTRSTPTGLWSCGDSSGDHLTSADLVRVWCLTRG